MIKYINIICLFVGYVFIHMYLNYTAQQNAMSFYDNRINNNKTNPKVYDIMHKHLPYWKNNYWLNNLIGILTLIPLIYTNDINMYFDFGALLLIVNIIRDITINLTILPQNKECELHKRSYMFQGLLGACYDKIFSGHTAFVFLLTLLYNSYSVITNVPLLIVWNIFNALSILIIRSHYTIDIFVSFLVCYTVFTEYMKNNHSFHDIVNIINNN